MPKFRKKPVVIEAWQTQVAPRADKSLVGVPEAGERLQITNWKALTALNPGALVAVGNIVDGQVECLCISIKTLEGTMHAIPGDWIIKGVKGEFYPCKPDIFAATYDEIEDRSPGSKYHHDIAVSGCAP